MSPNRATVATLSAPGSLFRRRHLLLRIGRTWPWHDQLDTASPASAQRSAERDPASRNIGTRWDQVGGVSAHPFPPTRITSSWLSVKPGEGGGPSAVLDNGLTESVNTKLRLLTHITYGFRSTDNLIALCLLDRGGHCPPLPGRQTTE